MTTYTYVTNLRRKLSNTINKYNRNLTPLGVRVIKYNNPDRFRVAYGTANRNSGITVNTDPVKMRAWLTTGHTHPNNQGKGIALALRTFAVAILKNSGFVRVNHQGVNYNFTRSNESARRTNYLPITTYIVRKYLGFRPVGNNSNGNFRSKWRTSYPQQKLRNAKNLSRRKLETLLH